MRFQPRIFENEVPVQKNHRPPPHHPLPPPSQPRRNPGRHHHRTSTRTSSLFLTILLLLLGLLPRSHQPPSKRDHPSGPVFPSPNVAIPRGWLPPVYISQPSPRVAFSRESVSGCHFISFFRISLPSSRDPTRVHGPPGVHSPHSKLRLRVPRHASSHSPPSTKRTLFPSLPSPLHRRTRRTFL